jgi:hypothetical protein
MHGPTRILWAGLAPVRGRSRGQVWDIGVDAVLFSFLLDEGRAAAGDYAAMGAGWSMTQAHWPGLPRAVRPFRVSDARHHLL